VRQSSGALRWTNFPREPHFAKTIAAIISNRRFATARVAFDSLPPGLYRSANVAAGK
jgi:hypothetical protein